MHGAADVVFYGKTNETSSPTATSKSRHRARCRHRPVQAGGARSATCPGPARRQAARTALSEDGPEPIVHNVHSLRISNDSLVYGTDRANRRVQVFTPDGKYSAGVRQPDCASEQLSGMAFGKPIRQLADSLLPGGSALGAAFSRTRSSGSSTSPTDQRAGRHSIEVPRDPWVLRRGDWPAPDSSTPPRHRRTRRAISTPLKSTSSGKASAEVVYKGMSSTTLSAQTASGAQNTRPTLAVALRADQIQRPDLTDHPCPSSLVACPCQF